MKNKLLIILLVITILLIAGCSSSKIGRPGSTHEHADFKVYINGEALNLSQEKYMVKSRYVHIEDMDGEVIHKHAIGITLGYFFDTLGMKFNSSCFILDNGVSYCNKDDKTLKFYINGERDFEFNGYEIRSPDKYLITYGNDSDEEIQKQLDSITNKAINLRG